MGGASGVRDRDRELGESGLRVLALALLAWAFVHALGAKLGATSPSGSDVATSRTLRPALARWSTSSEPAEVRVQLDSAPPIAERDWMVALAAAGTRVRWSNGGIRRLAVGAEPVADPKGATRVQVAALPGERVVLSDAGGVLDTLPIRRPASGATASVPAILRGITARAGRTVASAVVADSLTLRRVLVLGRVGWESRFVIDALEERGWLVGVDLRLAPRNDIVQGLVGTIDTARYAAVVALDSSAVGEVARLIAYVRSGGGLVLAGSAVRIGALRPIEAGVVGAKEAGQSRLTGDSSLAGVRGASDVLPIMEMGGDAVVLERRAGVPVVAARRVGAGRVVEAGYADTWRWRMMAAGGVRAHNDWWAGVVGSVAYAPAARRRNLARPDPAPLADLTEAFGQPMAVTRADATLSESRWRAWVFAGIVLALFAEWASRRLRGAR